MELNWALIAIKPVEDGIEILHICAYEQEPGDEAIMSLLTELQTDPDFGMEGMVHGEDFYISKVSRAADPEVFEALELPLAIDGDDEPSNANDN
jgi:hypothetical protein